MQDRSPDELDMALGQSIRLRRLDNRLSQTQLAEAIGVSFQQVQKYERGANRVSFSMMVRIARALGCRVSDLVADVDQRSGEEEPAGVPRELTVQPDAYALLEAYASIDSPRLRRAVLDLARNVSRSG
jgi:transcriptional regulator with XRE-family HTH domain